MKKCGIYCFVNMINRKRYIGQSCNIDHRKYCHLQELIKNKHFNQYLQSAFNKYGENNFEFRILEETEGGLLDVQERLWIAHYKSNQPEFGYNMESGGRKNKHHSKETCLKIAKTKIGERNPNFGKHLSSETIRKILDARKGYHHSKDTCRKISESNRGCKHYMFGKHHSVESRKKMSKARKGSKCYWFGKRIPQNICLKISESKKGQHHSEETKCKMSKSRTGAKNPMFGKHHSAETLRKILEAKGLKPRILKGITK